MTEKSNCDDREVKKIKSQEFSSENTIKDLPNPTCTVAATNTTSNQRNFTSNEQQQNLYSNLRKEIQHQISLTQKKKRQSNVKKTMNLKLSNISDNRMKIELQKQGGDQKEILIKFLLTEKETKYCNFSLAYEIHQNKGKWQKNEVPFQNKTDDQNGQKIK